MRKDKEYSKFNKISDEPQGILAMGRWRSSLINLQRAVPQYEFKWNSFGFEYKKGCEAILQTKSVWMNLQKWTLIFQDYHTRCKLLQFLNEKLTCVVVCKRSPRFLLHNCNQQIFSWTRPKTVTLNRRENITSACRCYLVPFVFHQSQKVDRISVRSNKPSVQ